MIQAAQARLRAGCGFLLQRRPALEIGAERLEQGELVRLEGNNGRLAARPVASLDRLEGGRGHSRSHGGEPAQP